MLREHIRSDHYEIDKTDALSNALRKNRASILGGLAMSRYGMAGVEISRVATAAETGAVAGRNARFFSRTGTNLMRTARFARFAGGTLSAAILVLEARNMSTTIQAMQSGSPCEKAERLREIRDEVSEIPDTASLDQEIESYLKAMLDRQRAMTQEEVTKILVEQSESALAEAKQLQLIEQDTNESTQGISILSGEEESGTANLDGDDNLDIGTTTTAASSSKTDLSMSLLERIEFFKQQQGESAEEKDIQLPATASTFSSDNTASEVRPPMIVTIPEEEAKKTVETENVSS
jgi:hypothetical protein